MELSQQIYDATVLMLDGIDSGKLPMLKSISVAVVAELRARLRPGSEPEEDVLVTAGTLLCLAMLEHMQRQGLTEFTAGTFHMDFSGDDTALTRTAFRLLAPWCSGGMALRGVRV